MSVGGLGRGRLVNAEAMASGTPESSATKTAASSRDYPTFGTGTEDPEDAIVSLHGWRAWSWRIDEAVEPWILNGQWFMP